MLKKYYKKGLIAITAFCTSLGLMSFSDDLFEVSKNLDIFSSVYKSINQNYVDEIETDKLMRTAIDAMLKSLDPYTVYYSESEIGDVKMLTTGMYGGIGAAVFTNTDGDVVIRHVYENAPSHKSGLQAGDIIVSVEGKSTKGLSITDVTALLKGQPNTVVNIKVKRVNQKEEIPVKLTRQEIDTKDVPYYGMLNDSIGYIKLSNFSNKSSKEMIDAFAQLKKNDKFSSLIIDLKSNPGGLLTEAVKIVNMFVDKGQLVVSTKGRKSADNKDYRASMAPIDTKIPIVVLTNSNSASASEIVSGAVQDLDRGVVLGQRTFGKGLVQSTAPVAFNGQIKMTIAKYYIPSGRCIQMLDYAHRAEDGSVSKIPDSLVQEFKTLSGRKVYDGGGVTPDVLTKNNEYSLIAKSLIKKHLIFDYAVIYRSKNKSIASADKFKLTDSEYHDFIKYLESRNFEFSLVSEKLLNDYKEEAVKENYFNQVSAQYEALKVSLSKQKQLELSKNESEIRKLLEFEIVSKYYLNAGEISYSLKNDLDISKAKEVLQNKSEYNKILTVSK